MQSDDPIYEAGRLERLKEGLDSEHYVKSIMTQEQSREIQRANAEILLEMYRRMGEQAEKDREAQELVKETRKCPVCKSNYKPELELRKRARARDVLNDVRKQTTVAKETGREIATGWKDVPRQYEKPVLRMSETPYGHGDDLRGGPEAENRLGSIAFKPAPIPPDHPTGSTGPTRR